jgi:Dockerin type I domain
MTLQVQANSVPSDPVFNFGGVFFNLIDVAQGYTFDPILVGAVSRKNHGSAGTFDIDLLPPASGIECRSGGATGDSQIVVTFAVPITFTSASVSGTGSVAIALSSGNQAFVNLTGVTNAQRITVTLTGANDGTHTADVSVPMGMLLGDTNADGFVNSADISQTKSQSGNAVTGSNFREDLNADGFINSADISLVKSKSGTALR